MEDVCQMNPRKCGNLYYAGFGLFIQLFFVAGPGKRITSGGTDDLCKDRGDRKAQQLKALSFKVRVLKMPWILSHVKCLFLKEKKKTIFGLKL